MNFFPFQTQSAKRIGGQDVEMGISTKVIMAGSAKIEGVKSLQPILCTKTRNVSGCCDETPKLALGIPNMSAVNSHVVCSACECSSVLV